MRTRAASVSRPPHGAVTLPPARPTETKPLATVAPLAPPLRPASAAPVVIPPGRGPPDPPAVHASSPSPAPEAPPRQGVGDGWKKETPSSSMAEGGFGGGAAPRAPPAGPTG